jgi:hypothetical protein
MVMPNIFFDETYPLLVSVEKGVVLTASNMNADKIFGLDTGWQGI